LWGGLQLKSTVKEMKNLIPALSPLASDISNHQPSGCFGFLEVRGKRPEISRSLLTTRVRLRM
jgi:hypothetical protein